MNLGFDSIKDEFKLESQDLLEAMEDGLLEAQENGLNEELIGSIFRAIHTIKGSAGMFNIMYIADFTHVVENLLDKIRSNTLEINDSIITLLLNCKDHISNLVVVATETNGIPSDDDLSRSKTLLSELSIYLNNEEENKEQESEKLISEEEKEEEVLITSDEENKDKKYHISLRLSSDILESGMDPISFLNFLGGKGNIYQTTTLTDNIPDLREFDPVEYKLGLELDIETEVSIEELFEVFDFLKEGSLIEIFPHNASVEEIRDWLETLKEDSQSILAILSLGGMIHKNDIPKILRLESIVEEKKTGKIEESVKEEKVEESVEVILKDESTKSSIPTIEPKVTYTNTKKETPSVANKSSSIRVDSIKIDRLINLIGEMVIANANVTQKALRQKNGDLIESVSLMSRMVEEIRESAMQVRMVQIGDTFNRYKRIVHDLSKDLGKKILLETNGGDTELDKTIIEKIGDPLIHIIRNAIDHGIETPEIRQSLGKNSQGTIKLSAFHDTGNIAIVIEDDGSGINEEKVLEKAVENGIVSSEDRLSKKEIHNLLFAPGFSTAELVTNISGRGVGMDVVKKNIESLRGTIDIDSSEGKGTKFTIRLPLTLAIIDGFLIRTGETHYVIPLDMVVECIELTEKEREEIAGNGFINLRNSILPLIEVSKFFNQKRKVTKRENIIVVKYADEKIGLIVDELLGEFQTVIKPLGKIFRRLKGISGATILGSGAVALILDVSTLVKEAISQEDNG